MSGVLEYPDFPPAWSREWNDPMTGPSWDCPTEPIPVAAPTFGIWDRFLLRWGWWL